MPQGLFFSGHRKLEAGVLLGAGVETSGGAELPALPVLGCSLPTSDLPPVFQAGSRSRVARGLSEGQEAHSSLECPFFFYQQNKGFSGKPTQGTSACASGTRLGHMATSTAGESGELSILKQDLFVVMSFCCFNKFLQTWWLKAT